MASNSLVSADSSTKVHFKNGNENGAHILYPERPRKQRAKKGNYTVSSQILSYLYTIND